MQASKSYSAQPTIYSRAYVYFNSLPTPNGHTLSVIEVGDGSILDVAVGLANSGGTVYWAMTFDTNTAGPTSSIVAQAGQWYCVEVYVHKNRCNYL